MPTESPGSGPWVDGAEVTVAPTEAASQAVALSSTRCGSVLLIGTSKADKAVAAHAKAGAIAMFQCLFAEEISKDGQHPNAAAANALRRARLLKPVVEPVKRGTPEDCDGISVASGRL